ncbi:hypothetical protein ACFX14_011983 [Malus domestica]
MYLASLINKGREVHTNGTADPTAFPAETVLELATINGAKSLRWDDETGSIEADLVVIINPSPWTMVPHHDREGPSPKESSALTLFLSNALKLTNGEGISSLMYRMRTENIVSVICNGLWIMKDRKIVNVDEEEVLAKAKQASAELSKRAGIKIPITKQNEFSLGRRNATREAMDEGIPS